MKIGIGLPNQIRDVEGAMLPAWASRAETAGFSSLGTVGRIAYPSVMDTIALAAAAGATSTIGLVTNVLLGPVWPPVLLAKEIANIDAISGGRLTLGIGLGNRPDDFVVEGLGRRGVGKRLEEDIRIYREVWAGTAVGGGSNPAVPPDTRKVPILFGGMVEATYERVARLGDGYIGASVPPSMAAGSFDGVRAAWAKAGREGSPRLVAIAYYAFGDIAKGQANVWDYYSSVGKETADFITAGVSHGVDGVKTILKAFEEIGADELIFHPTVDDLAEVERLAEAVL